jgi:hypothetical protein
MPREPPVMRATLPSTDSVTLEAMKVESSIVVFAVRCIWGTLCGELPVTNAVR